MRLPETDLNLSQKSEEKKIKKFRILNFVLVSSLSQDGLHLPLLGTIKNYFRYIKIYFEILKFILWNAQFPNYFIES